MSYHASLQHQVLNEPEMEKNAKKGNGSKDRTVPAVSLILGTNAGLLM